MTIGTWWGYAEAEPTIVGILIAVIVALAVVYVVKRATHGRGSRARSERKGRGARGRS